jgi:hypothetical protein
MKIRFRQSGGVVGSVRGVDLDTTALPEAEARELEALVRDALVRESGPGGDATDLSAKSRDLRQFEIRVEGEDRASTLVFDDKTLPPAVRPLVRFLSGRARPLGSLDRGE